ncbi:MAG: DUF898 domain-containing protein [Nitrospira sp.]|nr:DUF898 domain-containing protein [bacterium]MBL7048224.1 DUF898 domain-containing protein [Nitrospira sp.]
MDRFICMNCGFSATEPDLRGLSLSCPGCANSLNMEAPYNISELVATTTLQKPPEDTRHIDPEFTGTAGEYFRIWIVNSFFTIITLGVYAAWAKVRNRQYLYRNTIIDNHPFEYTANPVVILKGYIVMAFFLSIYFLTDFYRPIYSPAIIGLFYITIPFFIYKSLRFYAYNSTYRNIRFRFHGTLTESYKTYLFLPILIPFTLGLIIPYLAFRQKKYFFTNFAFGTNINSFEGRPAPFYKIYASAFFTTVISIFAVNLLLLLPAINEGLITNPVTFDTAYLTKNILASYAILIICMIYFQQRIFTWQTNYCWGHSYLGNVRFQSTIQTRSLIFIRATNIAAIFLSAGLLIPWAKVRQFRYILENLSVLTESDLSDIHASRESDLSALGDVAADMFNFDLGS